MQLGKMVEANNLALSSKLKRSSQSTNWRGGNKTIESCSYGSEYTLFYRKYRNLYINVYVQLVLQTPNIKRHDKISNFTRRN